MTQPVVDVEIEVDPQPDTGPDVVVVAPDAGGDIPAALLPVLTGITERLTALEGAVLATAAVASDAAFEAEMAQGTADVALDVAASTAAETEEALAAVAEEADAVTPEVVAEVEDISPEREHWWFAGRKVMKRDE